MASRRFSTTIRGSKFTGVLTDEGVKISMGGQGRCIDNVFVERLWRSLKYEDVYLQAYDTGSAARAGIGTWLAAYNTQETLLLPATSQGCNGSYFKIRNT